MSQCKGNEIIPFNRIWQGKTLRVLVNRIMPTDAKPTDPRSPGRRPEISALRLQVPPLLIIHSKFRVVKGQYFSHQISPLAFCYKAGTSQGSHGMGWTECWRHGVVMQNGIPTLQDWFWYLISARLKLPHTPPGSSLLWFDRHICHWVPAIWGRHVTVRALLPMSQTVTLSLEHTT